MRKLDRLWSGCLIRKTAGDETSRTYRCQALTVVSGCHSNTIISQPDFNICTDIQALATDPARQREGAATLLLKWAVDLVDKKGSRAMLEASDIAVKYGLYGKYGFRNVDAYYYVDNEHFPDMEGVHLVTMVRDAAER